MNEVQFYLRNRRQISQWATLETRAADLMREAVLEREPDKAMNLLRAASGEADVDFYVRNRSLITEWDSLQVAAGQALHSALLEAFEQAQLRPGAIKRGWTSIVIRSDELDDEQNAAVEIAWIRQHLLSTRRGHPFPRLALALPPARWEPSTRAVLKKATAAAARELGMTKTDAWWVHWGVLDEISDSQSLDAYAAACVSKLKEASERLYPVLVEALAGISEV